MGAEKGGLSLMGRRGLAFGGLWVRVAWIQLGRFTRGVLHADMAGKGLSGMMGGVGWKRMFVHVGQERPSRYPLTSSFSKTPPTHKPLYVIATEFPFFPSRLGEATFLSIRCKPTLLRA
ncbi:hypothetical protein QQP08_002458 [Theobroma cacao]|nr:hypothetical protein QQP08_002458 [Theobroma cacao]